MNIRYQHQLLALAASVALLGTGCASRVATTDGPPVTHAEAREAKIQAKSEYKAEKKVIEAQKLLERADCKTESVDQIEARDCKM